MVEFFDQFREISMETIFLRVVLALMIGGVVGSERERKSQPAGFRTYMLVCLGATLVMMTNQYILSKFGGGDPSRLGAQVVSGIGFLGAGSIIVTRNSQVRGLTTAAGLWTAACTGLAIGIGFYEGAIVAGVVVFFIMTFLRKIDKVLLARATTIRIYISFLNVTGMNGFVKFCGKKQYKIHDIQIIKGRPEDMESVVAIVVVYLGKTEKHEAAIAHFSELDGVVAVERI